MKYSILLAGVLLCASCVSLTSFQSPQALPPGSTSVGGGLALNYPLPEADFLFRYGLFNGVDVGGKVSLPFLSGTADVKWQFLRGPVSAAFESAGRTAALLACPTSAMRPTCLGSFWSYSSAVSGSTRPAGCC